jgi:hypothetical protein
MNMKAKIKFLIPGLLAACSLPFQDTAKREIRVILDRPPNSLFSGQNPDMTARKILPLLEAGYRLSGNPDLEDFVLDPPKAGDPRLRFRTVRDELARGVLFEKGEADVLFNSLSLSKTEEFRKRGHPVLSAKGHHLSYLGFNLEDPVLSRREVREAVFHALPLRLWIRAKYFDWVEPEGALTEAFDPDRSRQLLDQAGFPGTKSGKRLTLRFLTTPVREGSELALLLREALRRAEIELEIVPLETSLFFQRLKRKDFQLFASRMLRDSGNSSLAEYLLPGGQKNHFGWRGASAFVAKPEELTWPRIAPLVKRDLPLIPLFFWKHGLLLSRRIANPPTSEELEEDSFRFLSNLRLN